MGKEKTKVSWRQRISSKLTKNGKKAEDARLAEPVTTVSHTAILAATNLAEQDPVTRTSGQQPFRAPKTPDKRPSNLESDERTPPPEPVAPHVEKSRSFWASGYVQKKTEQPDLILAFEALLADEASGNEKPRPAPVSVLAGLWNKKLGRNTEVYIPPSDLGNGEYFVCSSRQMSGFIDERIERTKDPKEWKVPFSQVHVEVQGKIRSVVRGLLWAKEALTPIVSLEPHASVAWAGVCFVLPLLCSPLEQQDALIDGVAVITSTLCRLTVTERLYRTEYASTNKAGVHEHDVKVLAERFEVESINLLAEVIEFQARASCQMSRGTLSEYARNVVKADDWRGILQRITAADASCEKLARALHEEKYDREQQALSTTLSGLDKTVAELTDISKLTLKEMQAVSAKLDDQQVQNILDALDLSTYEKHKRVIPRHVEGTCKWFIDHFQYNAWKQSSSGVLWLAADPGCGKTVLSKHLIEDQLQANEKRATCYFFFRDGMVEQQGIERALCTLLHQLFTQRRHLVRHALSVYKSSGKAMAKSADGLWTILVNSIQDPAAGDVIFVLDALDECEESDRKDLVERISKLFLSEIEPSEFLQKTSEQKVLAHSGRGRAKFLLTSRPYHDINSSFQELIDKLPNVHLSADQETAAIRKEIDIVVDHRVAELATSLKLRDSTADMLATKLKAAENRTYLWLRLIFHAIEKKHGASKRDLENLIASIPDTVQKAYADILEQCIDPPKARRIFQLLVASQVPLNVRELSIAVALSEARDDLQDSDSDSEEEIEVVPYAIFRDQVRYVCGLFVAVIDDKVYFIHQTAREFLTMEHQKQHLETCIELPLRLPECHFIMTQASTSCLLDFTRGTMSPELQPFLRYSARYWDMHVAMAALSDGPGRFSEVYGWVLEICSHVDAWWAVRREREPRATRVDSLVRDADAQGVNSGSKQNGDVDDTIQESQDTQRVEARNDASPPSNAPRTVMTESEIEDFVNERKNAYKAGDAADGRSWASFFSVPSVASPIKPVNEQSGEPLMDDDIFDPDYFRRKQQGVVLREAPSIVITGENTEDPTSENTETGTRNVSIEENSGNLVNDNTDNSTQNVSVEDHSKHSFYKNPFFASPEEVVRAEVFECDAADDDSCTTNELRQAVSDPQHSDESKPIASPERIDIVTEPEQFKPSIPSLPKQSSVDLPKPERLKPSMPSFSKQESAEVLCLAFLGLAASLWLSCVKATEVKRSGTKQYSPPMLQWTLSDASELSKGSRLQLWISDIPHQPNMAGRGQSLHKILWEHSHFANLAKEHYSSSKTSTASNDLFAIARHETTELIRNLEEREAHHLACAPDHEASRRVLDEAFSTPASSPNSVFHFQQYLQRAGSGGYLWELEAGTASEKIYLRGPREISHQEDDAEVVVEDDVTPRERSRNISWGEDRNHSYDVESP